jgi:hypothetical protein
MRVLRLAAIAAPLLLFSQSGWAADKYTWDGNGSGSGSKCSSYVFHVELTLENAHATGWWQQKGREMRKFDLPVKADGTFDGEVPISNGNTVYVKGKAGATPSMEMTGYCDWGGPMKKE